MDLRENFHEEMLPLLITIKIIIMKNLIFSAVILAIATTGCKDKQVETSESESTVTEMVTPETSTSDSQRYACSMHPEITGKQGEKCSKCDMELTVPVAASDEINTVEPVNKKQSSDEASVTTKVVSETKSNSKHAYSINGMLADYLQLKNALIKDDSKGAAIAGKALLSSLNNTIPNTSTSKGGGETTGIVADAKEHAQHIGDNMGKIDHQREHFVMLSKNVNDLIKLYGTGDQKLYQDFCPMANDGNGAIWISEYKEIKNPYYGAKMLTCGSVKKQL